jgi:hypothetical protein
MTIFSLPYEPRRLQATEARLEAIYNAARKGLRGDTLALAAGMRPAEYRTLCEFDPLAALAEEKGRADGEMATPRRRSTSSSTSTAGWRSKP